MCKTPPILHFTTLPGAASLLHPIWRTHFVWRAPPALFLLYCDLFSDHDLFSDPELFTDRELRDARTLKNFTMLPDAASLLHPMWRMHFVLRASLALKIWTGSARPFQKYICQLKCEQSKIVHNSGQLNLNCAQLRHFLYCAQWRCIILIVHNYGDVWCLWWALCSFLPMLVSSFSTTKLMSNEKQFHYTLQML